VEGEDGELGVALMRFYCFCSVESEICGVVNLHFAWRRVICRSATSSIAKTLGCSSSQCHSFTDAQSHGYFLCLMTLQTVDLIGTFSSQSICVNSGIRLA